MSVAKREDDKTVVFRVDDSEEWQNFYVTWNEEQMDSRAHTLNNCYVPQQEMQEMETGCRAPSLDCYYHSQQSVQGAGQLNSVSRDGYYGNQQGMQGLGQLHSISARSHYGTQQSMQGLLQGQLGFSAPAMSGCFNIQENSVGFAWFHGITSKHLQDKPLKVAERFCDRAVVYLFYS